MADRYFNPFQGMDLRVPNRYREEFARYCQTRSEDGRPSSLLHSPFPRMVDMWFLAICLGVQQGKPAEYEVQDTYKFMDGTVLSSDPWRIDALIMMAVGYTGSSDIVSKPREILALASKFAVAGLDPLLEMLQEGDAQEPIWRLSDELERQLRKMKPQNAES